MLDETLRLQTCTHVHTRTFDEELVILDLDRGEYYALDEVGAQAWQHFAAGTSLGEVADSLLTDYQVARATLVSDLVRLADEWIALGLVQRRP